MFQNISGFPASLLLLGTISLLLFLGYELWETQQRNQVLTQRLLKLQEKVEGGSKSQEIYLSKAVKNTLVKQPGLIQPCYLNLLKSFTVNSITGYRIEESRENHFLKIESLPKRSAGSAINMLRNTWVKVMKM